MIIRNFILALLVLPASLVAENIQHTTCQTASNYIIGSTAGGKVNTPYTSDWMGIKVFEDAFKLLGYKPVGWAKDSALEDGQLTTYLVTAVVKKTRRCFRLPNILLQQCSD